MDAEHLETLEDIVNWQRKVRNVDASLHAVFAAKDREAKRKRSRMGFPRKPAIPIKKPVQGGPLASSG